MPRLNEITESVRPLIEEERAKAALAATISANRQFLKYLDREPPPSVENVRAWVESNQVLLLSRAQEWDA